MYNNQYEDYMRNSLGYNGMPMMDMNQMNMMNSNQMNMYQTGEMYETENSCMPNSVDDMYPEIYRIIYPMVCKSCMAVNENITEDLVSRMVNEIYMNVEGMEIVQEKRGASISVSPQPTKSAKSDSLSSSRTGSSLSSTSNSSVTSNSSSNNSRQPETRQRNPLLRDLIRILVLRELIGNPVRPQRPPFRPPFGGGPSVGLRPPFGF